MHGTMRLKKKDSSSALLWCYAAQNGSSVSTFRVLIYIAAEASNLVKTSVDEGSARRRDLYLTTCSRWDFNPQSQQTSGRTPHAIDGAFTGTTVMLL